jgi:hypothetical protein
MMRQMLNRLRQMLVRIFPAPNGSCRRCGESAIPNTWYCDDCTNDNQW